MPSGIDDALAPDQPLEPPVPALTAPARAPTYSRWPLLNPYTARHTALLSLGLVRFRPVSEQAESMGYSFAFGEGLATPRGAFLAGGLHEHELRFVPKDALSLSLSRYQWEAGPRLGPVEPMARVGFTLVHLDVGHGVSFGMFSPRVGVGLWLKLAHTRIGVSAFTEYFWRWFGDDSAFVHGLTLEFQPDSTPLIGPGATSSPAAPSRR